MSKRSQWCRHFTGIQNKVCKAGITYDSVRDSSATPYRWPCTLGGGACDKLELYTDAEIAAEEASFKVALDNMMKARVAINAAEEASGIIPCPCCEKGQLGFSVDAGNEHIHAACSTAGCVRWME